MGITHLGDLRSPWLLTTYKSWDDPPSSDEQMGDQSPGFMPAALQPFDHLRLLYMLMRPSVTSVPCFVFFFPEALLRDLGGWESKGVPLDCHDNG